MSHIDVINFNSKLETALHGGPTERERYLLKVGPCDVTMMYL